MYKVEFIDNTYTVLDTEGGRWWPNNEAIDEINSSDSPEQTALRICKEEPMRGHWIDWE